MSILHQGSIPSSTGGYNIERSLRFNSADSAYLNRTPGSAGNRKAWTWSGWVKRSTLGSLQYIFCAGPLETDQSAIRFNSDDTLDFFYYTSSFQWQLTTTQVFRDVSSWYHIVVALDTDNATANNRQRIYVNGSEVTVFTNRTNPSSGATGTVNNTVAHRIGVPSFSTSTYQFSGYLADVHLIDGSALTPSSFGENDTDTGVWKPKAYTGSYGTNGFKLTFSDNSGTTATTLGKDSSGNGNNWTPNNFSVTTGAGNDSLVDTPTLYGTDTGAGGEVRGNYATWNPLWTNVPTISNGNLDVTGPDNTAMATIGMSSGKWYFETTITNVGAISAVGMCATQPGSTNYPGHLSDGYAYISSTGNKQNNNSTTSYGASYTTGDVIGCAFDADAGTLTFYKNGVSQGTAYSSIPSKTYYFAVYGRSSGGSNDLKANFGQRPFAYTAPAGFKALCTQNLPTPTIQNGATAFNTLLWTGNGTTQSITGVGFQPDLVWAKSRTTADNNALYDVIRGTGKILFSNSTSQELNFNALTSFDANGFSVSTAGGTLNETNKVATNYVAWNWKAGGTGVTNTAGSITSTVSANQTAGFSIVSYSNVSVSAQTIGHGLGATPDFIICKGRTTTFGWPVYHKSLGKDAYLLLNTTDAQNTGSANYWGTSVNSSTFGTLGNGYWNGQANMIAYCFAAVAGYSAFGSYTGNGSADGSFVYTGFRPAYILIKKSSAAGGNWWVIDNKRDVYNVTTKILAPSLSDAESSGTWVDFTSNGFKIRTASSDFNDSGQTHVYAAFAEVPFRYSLAR